MPVRTIDARLFGRAGALSRSSGDDSRLGWPEVVGRLAYAFQPIVNIHTGACVGVEALLRGFDSAGFRSISEVFDRAHHEGELLALDMALREKAIRAFLGLPQSDRIRLFYNLDNRLLADPDYSPTRNVAMIERNGIAPQKICLELSERHSLLAQDSLAAIIDAYRQHGVAVAIDDFGAGFSGLQFLHQAQPTIVKIDRFFVSGIERDLRKRLIASHIVSVAHGLGILVIAEGVETEMELGVCRDIACDYVQGWLIARPTLEPGLIRDQYPVVEEAAKSNRRRSGRDPKFVRDGLEHYGSIADTTPLIEVLRYFRSNVSRNFVPLIDQSGWPAGIVREADLKAFTYSPYGRDLLANPASRRVARSVAVSRPVADVTMDAEALLDVFVSAPNEEGILITQDMRYIGVLGAPALLRVINEANLRNARDQNPLTRLPGNNRIYEFASNALADRQSEFVLAYLDFDNFKPFNDTYGFRQGDRIILAFAERLSAHRSRADRFAGHIGGDDFFLGFRDCARDLAESEVLALLEAFAADAESFYDPEARQRGHIVAKGRNGRKRNFPLLTASAVLAHLPRNREGVTLDQMAQSIAAAKPASKAAPLHIAWAKLRSSSTLAPDAGAPPRGGWSPST